MVPRRCLQQSWRVEQATKALASDGISCCLSAGVSAIVVCEHVMLTLGVRVVPSTISRCRGEVQGCDEAKSVGAAALGIEAWLAGTVPLSPDSCQS